MKTLSFILSFLTFSLISIAQNDLTSNLIICMPMNGNTNDYSGYNNNGVLNGATLTTDRLGNLNSAYHFNGTSNYITIPYNSSLGCFESNDEITITAWCNINDWYQGYNIFSIIAKSNPVTDMGWEVVIANPPVALGKDITLLSDNQTRYHSLCGVSLHTWYFFSISYSKSLSTAKLYKDGVLCYTGNTSSGELENTGAGDIYLGYSPAGVDEYSDGDIDEVRVYNRALTDAEILGLYNGDSPCIPQVGIEEYNMKVSFFSIYPNPTTTTLNINFNTQFINDISKIISIKVFSIDGKLVKIEEINKSELNQHIINISSLSKGLYYLTITSGNYSQNLKFIKE